MGPRLCRLWSTRQTLSQEKRLLPLTHTTVTGMRLQVSKHDNKVVHLRCHGPIEVRGPFDAPRLEIMWVNVLHIAAHYSSRHPTSNTISSVAAQNSLSSPACHFHATEINEALYY